MSAMSRAALLVVALVVAVFGSQSHAAADDLGFGEVDCEQFPDHPDCRVSAGVFAPVMSTGPEGSVVCRLDGEVVPCVTDEGWLGSDGCRYLHQAGAVLPPGVEGPGGVYLPTCPADPPNARRTLVWIPDADAPAAALGAVAVSRLVLPRPQVVLSPPPTAPQLVRLPTWLWLEEGWWAAERHATASVPGVGVTAVATPVRVDLQMGDGGLVSCHGPGTAWTAGMDPRAQSPDCGYVYSRPSAGQPGGAYTVSATVTWAVSWSGAGASGQAGPLFSTGSQPVAVVESQTVVTGD